MSDPVTNYLREIGAKGGKAGTGAAKRRATSFTPARAKALAKLRRLALSKPTGPKRSTKSSGKTPS